MNELEKKFKETMENKFSRGPVTGMIHNHVLSLLQAGLEGDMSYQELYNMQLNRVLETEIMLEKRLQVYNEELKAQLPKTTTKRSF
jgi:hypothetical protein